MASSLPGIWAMAEMIPPNSDRKRHPASLPADKRRNIRFSETERPLREDVHQLGRLIGAVVKDRGGEELFNAVEAVRSLAIASRNGDVGAHDRLHELLSGFEYPRAREVSLAFSTWFQAIQYGRATAPGSPPQGLSVRCEPATAAVDRRRCFSSWARAAWN